MRGADAGDVEAVDLEPIALETPPRPSPPRVPFGIVAIVGATVIVGWAGIAFATRHHTHRAPPPAAAASPAPTTVPNLPAGFVEALGTIGSGRFATIVNDRLYVVDARSGVGTAVDLGVPAESIDAQSRLEVLVRTPDGEVIVDTTGLGLDIIPNDRRAYSTYDGQWWVVGNDGTFSRNGVAAVARLPDGLAIVASNAHAFVATRGGRYVLWSTFNGTVRDRGATANRVFLNAGATWVAFTTTCDGRPCDELLDNDGSDRTFAATGSGNSVAVSLDGRRVAVGQQVVDRTNGRVLATLPFPLSTTGIPFTWATDGTLVIARNESLAVLRPGEREPEQTIDLAGIRQIVALP